MHRMEPLDYHRPGRSAPAGSLRRPLFIFVAMLHLLSIAVFVLTLMAGPPMGEAEMTPWDYIAPTSCGMTFLLCPLAYLLIAVLVR